MLVEQNKVVSLSYEVRIDAFDGELVDSADKDSALSFIYGSGNMLPEFEKKIAGLDMGKEFKFNLTSNQAYGAHNAEFLMELPIDIFKENGKINDKLMFAGNVVPMRDEQGNQFDGLILSFDDKVVNMDFNHPLAGKELFFTGKIIEVREATTEEISHGHIHGQGHHHNHDCGSHNHDHGCGGGCC
ncbi:MAG: hypothetical protein A2033_14045 [Bacteroidetes bacterium GWA2_31_9]|nr:MAG: hypothetical protein A2033_14045 [Bacteroidetes bacterium GWA2_31_9]